MALKSKRKYYITIQSPTDTSDSQGGGVISWTDLSNKWARVVISSQSRTLDQGGVKYKRAVEFTIREGTEVTVDNRIVWDSENYTIHSVVPSSRLGEQIIIAYV